MGNKGYKVSPNILFWVRLKTLQTNNSISRILQIAYIFTDIKLTVFQEGLHFVIRCRQEELDKVDHKQLKLIKENGLYEACVKSKTKIEQAEQMIMKEIQFRQIARGQLLAAGKQAHLAKYALMCHMPKLHDFLHYRIFDLSSVQFVVERFKECRPEQVCKQSTKGNSMMKGEKRAKQEVWQDIHQMQFYTQHALNDN